MSLRSVYGEPIPVKELAERVASYVHLCTLPFGCGVILGDYDRDGPQLYMVEPSGVSYIQQLLREEKIDFGAMMGSGSGSPGGGLPSHFYGSYASNSSMRRRRKNN
ncbi:Proteasome subunit alpha [Arachis hypogaea]|nr:Proteasome subunit alpha [Arachis hypogaea]